MCYGFCNAYMQSVYRKMGDSCSSAAPGDITPWVDSDTATKARVRFARICVQIDVKKPLVTTILIGK